MEVISLEDLGNLNLHDSGLESINIDFTLKEINIIIEIYYEVNNNYDRIEIIFKDISEMNLVDFIAGEFKSVQIDYHEVQKVKEGKPNIKFIVLFGYAEGAAIINFSFSTSYIILEPSTI